MVKFIKIIKSNEQEEKNTIELMKSFNEEEKPQTGPFWWDNEKKQVFLSTPIDYDLGSEPNKDGDSTNRKLHQKIWQKEFYRGRVKGDYKQIPRGRVFYNVNNKIFKIKVGSWFRELSQQDQNTLIEQVKFDFNLQKQQVKIIEENHWNIGNGFEF